MPDHQDHPAIIREASRHSGTVVTESSPIVCIKMKADHKNQLRGLSGGHHPTTTTDKVIEKPPPGPVKRKKKLDRSLVDLSCSPKMEQKRQKITTDAEVDTTAAASAAVDVQHQATNPPPKELAQSARGSKAKELQNHTLFKWRRKNEETNAALVQKLNAYTEQLRLEINDLKTALISEKNAVRALRAQQEAVTRKLKLEVKQTKEAKEHQQQLQNSHQTKKVVAGSKCGSETEPNYTVQCSKLQHEIAVLREQNKILEGKIQSSADADKKKVSDIRGLKEAYDLRLTQVTKSAKLEIHRLLEEIKAKDKAIQILKKDLLTAKDSPKKPPNMRKETPKTASAIAKPAPTNLLVDSVKQLSSQAGEQNENADPQKPVKGNEIEMMNAINLRSELEFVQTENDILKSELNSAQEEIKSLKATLAITKDDEKSIYERIRVLEFKESELLKEAHELREQNDLLEFRIVELEESHDKWSLRSHPATTMTPSTSTSPHSSTSTQQHTRDALWTDPEKEADDMMMMMSERSDSGVTSPHSNHQSEDRLSMPSPCDLAMIDSDNDDIRKRILSMTKRSCYDEEDKIALMQILSLLNNLEALSQDHEISGEFSSLDSATINNVAAMGKSDGTKINGHMVPVATVQPFTDASSPMDEEPIMPQLKNSLRMTGSASGKVMLWNSLQESGVFEEQMVVNQATQTHTDEFPLPERPGDLTTEIQKLYKFRERIEEVVGSSKKGSNSLLSPDQRKLEYYKERAEALERKLTIYESSDDVQLRKLGERLQREIQLEALSKRMEQTIAELEKTNQVLEEERCEFEEAENDTRLKFQRLEVDFELMTQRNVELEMGEEALQAKLQEAKKQLAIYEERVQQMERRLEEVECLKRSCSTPTESLASSAETELRQQVGEMLKREQAMQQNLDELKRAYNETLENADNVWAEMENEYKCKLKECEVNEQGLQSKLQQLEERIKHDSQFAQERLMQMEEVEANLKLRIGALNRENKDLVAKYSSFLDEFNALKEEYQKLKIYLTGPAAELLERERRKVGSLEEELKHSNEMLVQLEARSKDNILGLKLKMTAAIKELENIRITNNELQEEVVTLEARVVDAKRMQTVDEETIRHLTEELRVKQKQLNNYQTSAYRSTQPNLAQELSQVNSFPALPAFMKPKVAVAEPVVFPKGVKRVAETVLEQNGKPKLLPKPEDIPRLIIRAKDP